jgi:hypothetical protein
VDGEVDLEHAHPLVTEQTYRYRSSFPAESRNQLIVRGFLPGRAHDLKLERISTIPARLLECAMDSFTVPVEGSDIHVSAPAGGGWQVRGRIHGAHENESLVDLALDLSAGRDVWDVLKTGNQGQFATFSYHDREGQYLEQNRHGLFLSWQGADEQGRSTIFRWPVVDVCDMTEAGPNCDIDLSQWARLHVVFGDFQDRNKSIDLDLAGFHPRLTLLPPLSVSRRASPSRSPQQPRPLEAGWDRLSRNYLRGGEIQSISFQEWQRTKEYFVYSKPGTYELICGFHQEQKTSDHIYYLPEVVLEPGQTYEVSVAPPGDDAEPAAETGPAESVSSTAG